MEEHVEARRIRDGLFQNLQSFCGEISLQHRKPSQVSARPRKAHRHAQPRRGRHGWANTTRMPWLLTSGLGFGRGRRKDEVDIVRASSAACWAISATLSAQRNSWQYSCLRHRREKKAEVVFKFGFAKQLPKTVPRVLGTSSGARPKAHETLFASTSTTSWTTPW